MRIHGQLGKQKVNALSPEAFRAEQDLSSAAVPAKEARTSLRPQVLIAPDSSSQPARWVRIAPDNSSPTRTETAATGTYRESSGAIGTKNAISNRGPVNPVNKRSIKRTCRINPPNHSPIRCPSRVS